MNYVVELDVGASTFYSNVQRTMPYRIGNSNVVSEFTDRIFDPVTHTTLESLTFRDKSNNSIYQNTSISPPSSRIPSFLVSQARVAFGKYVHPNYVIDNHSAANSTWIKVGKPQTNPVQRNSTNYSNNNYSTLPSPYDSVNSPNNDNLVVVYNSNMASTQLRNRTTNPIKVNVRLDSFSGSTPFHSIDVDRIMSGYVRPR